MAKHFPQERVQSNTVEQIVAVTIPPIREGTGQLIHLVPQDRISDRNGEQTIDIPIPQIQEKLVEIILLILQERISERIGAMLASQIQEKLFKCSSLFGKNTFLSASLRNQSMCPLRELNSRTTCRGRESYSW